MLKFLPILLIIIATVSCEKKDLVDNTNIHGLKTSKAFALINGSTFTNGEVTFNYSDLIKHSMDYLKNKNFQNYEPSEQKELFVESITDFLGNICHLDESDISLYEQSIWNNVNSIENKTVQTCNELSKQQVEVAEEILIIAKNSTSINLRKNLELINNKINLLPIQERLVLNNSVSLLLTANEVVMSEMSDKSFWGSFICNALCSGVGCIYGAAVGAVCPPAGVVVGIVVGSGLSTAVC